MSALILPKVLYLLATANRRLYWDKEKIQRYQEKHLRSVVRYAYNFVPFYHEKYRAAGIDPNDIKRIQDLSKLPIVKSDEFKKQVPSQLVSKEFEIEKLKKVSTSGSTGKPLVVHINRSEDAWRKAIYMRANISCGQRPRDHWVVLTAPCHFHDTTGLQRKLGIFAQTVVSLFESTDQKIRQVEEARPDVLDGYSSSLLLLAKVAEQQNLTTIQPRLMFGSSESIAPRSRRYLEKVFGAPFYDQFGCSELDRTAWQCPRKQGYHMDVDSVITQFIGKDGGEVALGEPGEVVYTSLFNYSMPFIRYAIGDVGVPSEEDCSCERGLPLMKVVEGRQDHLLPLPNNRVLSPLFFAHLMDYFKYNYNVEQYFLRQRKLDFIEVNIKKRTDVVDDQTMASELKYYLESNFMPEESYGVRFEVIILDEIPIPKTGKLMAVFSDLKKDDLK
ncbi:phenylacetate--CoA ligase family protein [Candidatus Bathyarchaeota archaeon]|nr:phenylacetate--CoA ligase family protein [Candidatus Bathyarchaeota archaeon]